MAKQIGKSSARAQAPAPVVAQAPALAVKASAPALAVEVTAAPALRDYNAPFAVAAAAIYAANVAARKPTACDVIEFASPAVERSIRARLATGFNTAPQFRGVNGTDVILIPPPGTDVNESVFKATAAALKADLGCPKVLTGNAVVLTALAIAIDAFPGEPIAVKTVARIAATLCVPKESEIFRAGPEAFYGTSEGANYIGTCRTRGFSRSFGGAVK